MTPDRKVADDVARLTTTEQYLDTVPHADATTITALNNIRNRSS